MPRYVHAMDIVKNADGTLQHSCSTRAVALGSFGHKQVLPGRKYVAFGPHSLICDDKVVHYPGLPLCDVLLNQKAHRVNCRESWHTATICVIAISALVLLAFLYNIAFCIRVCCKTGTSHWRIKNVSRSGLRVSYKETSPNGSSSVLKLVIISWLLFAKPASTLLAPKGKVVIGDSVITTKEGHWSFDLTAVYDTGDVEFSESSTWSCHTSTCNEHPSCFAGPLGHRVETPRLPRLSTMSYCSRATTGCFTFQTGCWLWNITMSLKGPIYTVFEIGEPTSMLRWNITHEGRCKITSVSLLPISLRDHSILQVESNYYLYPLPTNYLSPPSEGLGSMQIYSQSSVKFNPYLISCTSDESCMGANLFLPARRGTTGP